VVSPDGTTDADKLVEFNGLANQSFEQTITLVAGTSYAISVYAQAAERIQFRLAGRISGSWSVFPAARIDLSNGTVLNSTGDRTATVESVGNGWYRCTIFGTATATNAGVIVSPLLTGGTTSTYTGDGTSGIYLWGAQLETGSTSTTYIPTQAAASGPPRFDYDPVTLAPMGLLIEEQRVNSISPSADFSGANWVKSNIAIDASTTTAPDGSVCSAYAGSVGTSLKRLRFNLTTTTTGAYTWSLFVKAGTEDSCSLTLQDGTAANGANITVRLTDGVITAGPNINGTVTGVTAIVQPSGNGFYRIALTVTFVSALTQIQAILTWDVNGSSSTTGTLFPWGAQLEAGAFPTSYIPTVASQVTRASDNASMLGTNFSSWYNQSAGTVYAEFVQGVAGSANAPVQNLGVWSAADSSLGGTFNGYGVRITPNSSSAGSIQFTGRSGATIANASPLTSGFLVAGVTYKTASAWDSTDMVIARTGAVGTTITNTVASTLTTQDVFRIGTQTTGGSPPYSLNGHIKRIAFYPRRLSNAELQGITS
jgi:hypothetical protein